MKKITYLIIFLSMGAFAQTFPSPYCNITEYYDIEEITSVSFANAAITNSVASSVLIDKTATVANVQPGQSYAITVKGNSYGSYDNEYVAFIDWNHNNVLNDAGEEFYIGLIFNSTGNDTKTATVNIMVPSNALAGNTRIRIVKTYTAQEDDYVLVSDPCNIQLEDTFFEEVEGTYGQALDFTLNVGTLGTNSFDATAFSAYPNPVKNILNVNYKSDISDVKIYNLLGQEIQSNSVNSSDFKIDVSNLSTGTYVVKLFGEEGSHSFKLIKD
jgi:hypothetical protein